MFGWKKAGTGALGSGPAHPVRVHHHVLELGQVREYTEMGGPAPHRLLTALRTAAREHVLQELVDLATVDTLEGLAEEAEAKIGELQEKIGAGGLQRAEVAQLGREIKAHQADLALLREVRGAVTADSDVLRAVLARV